MRSRLTGEVHPHHLEHPRYGPYFIYPAFQRRLDFGESRSFELVVAAFCDPHVTPERVQLSGMRNGIAVVFHDRDHEIIILDGHRSADRIRLHGPTDEQIAEYRRVGQMSWDEFVTFCCASPTTYAGWRRLERWTRLGLTHGERSDAGSSAPNGAEHAVR